MASEQIHQLQKLIDYITRLGKEASKAQPTLQALEKELRGLISTVTKAGKEHAPMLKFSTTEAVENIARLTTELEKMGVEGRLAGDIVRETLENLKQIWMRATEQRIPLGRVEAHKEFRGKKPITTELVGSQAEIDAFLRNEAAIKAAGITLDETIGALKLEFEGLDTSVKVTGSALDVVTGNVTLQTQAVTKLQESWEGYTERTLRVAPTGERLAPSAGVEMLQKTLGTERFDEFNQKLGKMRFSMANLTHASEDSVAGIKRFIFSTKEGTNVTRQASFTIDKWGRVLKDTGTRFKSFDQMLSRNITKVLEWAISVGVVFGTMQMLQQSFRDLIEMQSAMADLAIITGESTNAMSRYFDTLAAVARETGTEITDVMEGAAVAIRVGEGATEAERLASGFEFLGDAAAYAKLANIDVAKSADLLNATMSQLGKPIGETEELLDKWVAVSRFANVSMLDLGQGFATAAGAATSAGVSVDELNGYIAAMSVATSKSAQESANALRAGFAAIQQPSTQKALLDYGIAVTDVDGHMRDWSEILNDINMLLSTFGKDTTGAEEALSKLAYALGGQGARRQADWVAFLNEQNTAQEATNKSMEAEGELEEALAIKTDTLRDTIIDLKNAFMELVETLGMEGGFLDLLTNSVTVLTTVVGGIESLTEALGPATTAITAFFVAWAVGSKMALAEKIAKGGMIAGVGAGLKPMVTPGPAAGRTGAMYGAATTIATGLATGDWQQAAGRGIGTWIGYTLGGPLGGMIGATIGDSFLETIGGSISYLEAMLGKVEYAPTEGMTKEDILGELREIEIGPGLVGSLFESIMRAAPEYEGLDEEEFLRALVERKTVMEEWGMLPEMVERSDDLVKALDKLTVAVEEAETIGGAMPGGAYQQAMTGYRAQLMPQLQEQLKERRKELPIEFMRGQAGGLREYAATLERTRTIGDQLIPVFFALESASDALGVPIKSTQQEFTNLGMEMVAWSDESITFIMEQATALIELQNQGKATTEIFQEFFDLLQGVRTISIGQAFGPFPGIKDFGDVTAEEFQTVIASAREAQELAMSQLGIPDEVINSIDKWAYHLKGSGEEAYGWMEGLSQQFVDGAIQDLEELKGAQEDTFNVRRLKDVDPSKMGEIAAANRYWVEYLSRMKGMTAQEYLDVEGQQFNLILGEGNVLQQLYSTNEAMLFALQDIKEIEEKQLEGMWNIPSGATFWVPLTSLFYQQGEGGGFPELPELLPPTKRTATSTGETAISTRGIDAKMAELIAIQLKPGMFYDEFKALVDAVIEPSVAPLETPAWSDWLGDFLGIDKPIGAMPSSEDVNQEIWRLTNLADQVLQGVQEPAPWAPSGELPEEPEPSWLEKLFGLPTEQISRFPGRGTGGGITTESEESVNWLEKIWSSLKLPIAEEGVGGKRPSDKYGKGLPSLPTPYEIVGDEFMLLWRTLQKKIFGKGAEVGTPGGFPIDQDFQPRPTEVQPPTPWEAPIVVDPTVDVNVEIESKGTFIMHETITLDGAPIARYVRRIMAEELETTINSHETVNRSVR